MTNNDNTLNSNSLRTPENLLLIMTFVMPLAFSAWMALLNNFSIEVAQFTGKEIGILQSLREIPGFLAFTAVFILLVIKEQTLALASLLILGIGVSITGFFPHAIGLYLTTILMSIGFHYFETINQSLTLQWLPKHRTAHFMGKLMATKSIAAAFAFIGIWVLTKIFPTPYLNIYLIFGGMACAITLFIWCYFPQFSAAVEQKKSLVIKKRYWLFYTLTFLSGARRQIFVVFAGFLMVEKFHYDAGDIALLFLANHIFNMLFASRIGAWIGKIGERKALTIEYIGLIVVFTSYAFVENSHVAAGLYIIDHLFFAMAIAIKTYFQKIASPEDIASTAGVSFTINHIAAVALPALLGLIWLSSPTIVFLVGAGIAVLSLILARFIPYAPSIDNEVYKREHP